MYSLNPTALALFTLVTLAATTAQADDCFILVHGHNPAGHGWGPRDSNVLDFMDPSDCEGLLQPDCGKAKVDAEAYWHRNGGSFLRDLTDAGANYGIVGWDARNLGGEACDPDDERSLPYWHPYAAGEVASQIIAITSGQGDITQQVASVDPNHEALHPDTQCGADDTFYLVGHSQGMQVMTYIAGNQQGAFGDTAIDALSLQEATDCGDDCTVPAPFAEALAPIERIYSLTGATNGSQIMDLACANALTGAAAGIIGKNCVESLQTYQQFNPSEYTSETLSTPVYAIGAYRGYGFPMGASSALLNGEDDGTVNLASQMNCIGSPARDLDEDFKERDWLGRVVFRCGDDSKRHFGHYNLASIYNNHDSVRWSDESSPHHEMDAKDVPDCGEDENSANTILQCLSYTN